MNKIRSYLEKKSHIIWDWNGTLLNDLELCVEVLGILMAEYGLSRIPVEKHREHFRFPVQAYYEELGFNFELLSFEKLALRYSELYESQVIHCQLFDQCKEFLEETGMRGISHSILSAGHQEKLLAQVKYFEVGQCFENIRGVSHFQGSGKIDVGRGLIQNLTTPKSEIILIGDTDHDLAVGKELGLDVLLIADGHQSYERLARLHPMVLESRY